MRSKIQIEAMVKALEGKHTLGGSYWIKQALEWALEKRQDIRGFVLTKEGEIVLLCPNCGENTQRIQGLYTCLNCGYSHI